MSDLQYEPVSHPAADVFKECKSPVLQSVPLRVKPSGFIMTNLYPELAQKFLDFEVREDDVWIISFPKCGTTWTQEMAWLIGYDCDFKTAKEKTLNQRVPFIEYVCITRDTGAEGDTLKRSAELESPRFIKTHLPKDLLPRQLWTKKPKIIYVSRDPKDAAISYYHHYRLWNAYKGCLNDFLEAFLHDTLVYCPFWDHVLDFWKLRKEPNILFNAFEDMKKDLPAVIRRTARFLGKSLTEDQLQQLANHLDFRNMKDNPAVNKEDGAVVVRQINGLREDGQLKFMRSGEAGGWRREMAPEMAQRFDTWTQEKLRGTDYQIGVSAEF